MKLFIDTNIFLDLILKRDAYKEALLIFNAIEKRIFEAFVLDITLLNIDYIAKKQIKDIRSFINVINKTFKVLGGSNSSIEEALLVKNMDLEDNLQYVCAQKHNCDLIITNDKSFFSVKIKTLSSCEFVAAYLSS